MRPANGLVPVPAPRPTPRSGPMRTGSAPWSPWPRPATARAGVSRPPQPCWRHLEHGQGAVRPGSPGKAGYARPPVLGGPAVRGGFAAAVGTAVQQGLLAALYRDEQLMTRIGISQMSWLAMRPDLRGCGFGRHSGGPHLVVAGDEQHRATNEFHRDGCGLGGVVISQSGSLRRGELDAPLGSRQLVALLAGVNRPVFAGRPRVTIAWPLGTFGTRCRRRPSPCWFVGKSGPLLQAIHQRGL
jgi:hypothetical protein